MMISLLITSFSIFSMMNDSITIYYSLNKNMINDKSIIDTSITISSINASNADTLVTIILNNNGTTKIWNYNNFDLIITYDANMSNNKVRITEYLSYSTTLTTGKWIIKSITNDLLDPDIINPTEQAIIHAKLSYTPYDNGIIIITISTDNGSTYSLARVI